MEEIEYENDILNSIELEPFMKKCPFCAEEIQDEAIKCKHCKQNLQVSQKNEFSVPAMLTKKNNNKISIPRWGWLLIILMGFYMLSSITNQNTQYSKDELKYTKEHTNEEYLLGIRNQKEGHWQEALKVFKKIEYVNANYIFEGSENPQHKNLKQTIADCEKKIKELEAIGEYKKGKDALEKGNLYDAKEYFEKAQEGASKKTLHEIERALRKIENIEKSSNQKAEQFFQDRRAEIMRIKVRIAQKGLLNSADEINELRALGADTSEYELR